MSCGTPQARISSPHLQGRLLADDPPARNESGGPIISPRMHDRGDLPELTDGVVLLRPLTLSDAQSWHEGDDEEARRWFQFPPERELPWGAALARHRRRGVRR